MVEWAVLVPASVVVAATPGANQLLALRNGVRVGMRAAVVASLGRFAAFALMVVAVAVGVGALLATSQVMFDVLKWAGVAYLVWLGVRAIGDGLRARRRDRGRRAGTASSTRAARAAGVRGGDWPTRRP